MADEDEVTFDGGSVCLVDIDGLTARLDDLREEYAKADPWPHLVLHGVFPDDVLDEVVAELRAVDRGKMASASTRTMVKRETADPTLLGPATRAVLGALDSGEFLAWLSAVTGVPDLSADSIHHWAGVHETAPGGFTMVHTDFRSHPVTGLHHRTNVLLYLNRGWRQEWGGELELWSPDMHRRGRRVVPEANTLVVFETNGRSMHGLPNPVACPEGLSRLSLAAYQYSPHAPAPGRSRRRWSKYAARPGDDWRVGMPTWWDLKERLPQRAAVLGRRGRALARRLAGRR